jgi:hypothetical protein
VDHVIGGCSSTGRLPKKQEKMPGNGASGSMARQRCTPMTEHPYPRLDAYMAFDFSRFKEATQLAISDAPAD